MKKPRKIISAYDDEENLNDKKKVRKNNSSHLGDNVKEDFENNKEKQQFDFFNVPPLLMALFSFVPTILFVLAFKGSKKAYYATQFNVLTHYRSSLIPLDYTLWNEVDERAVPRREKQFKFLIFLIFAISILNLLLSKEQMREILPFILPLFFFA
jgi:hypothetical protein